MNVAGLGENGPAMRPRPATARPDGPGRRALPAVRRLVVVVLATLGGVGCGEAPAPAARIAVAANFAAAAEELAAELAGGSERLQVVRGASGALYAQIRQGAPFDAFLSADAERPRRLVEEGLAVAGSRFTYALGRLVLWVPGGVPAGVPGAGLAETLADGALEPLAIANPEVAPYGVAARESLLRLGLWEGFAGRAVRGESVVQAHGFVASGAAAAGLVALSLVIDEPPQEIRVVPEELYAPLEQQAVLLPRGVDAPAAGRFLAALASPAGRERIRSLGYGVPEAADGAVRPRVPGGAEAAR